MRTHNLFRTAITFFALLLPISLIAQPESSSPTPTPTPTESERRIAEIDREKLRLAKETELLQAQNAYYAEIRTALQGGTNNAGGGSQKGNTGATAFSSDDVTVKEVVTLSYEAMNELSTQANELLRPSFANYDRVVFYYDDDFKRLSRYRFYRTQVRHALANYKAFRTALATASRSPDSENDRPKRAGSWSANLGMLPTIGTAVTSVADLINLFRTDTTITAAKNDPIQDDLVLIADIADKMLLDKPTVQLYNPGEFVSEFEMVGSSDGELVQRCDPETKRRFADEIVCINAAKAYVDYFISAMSALPDATNNSSQLGRLVASAKVIKIQVDGLSFAVKPDPLPIQEDGSPSLSEFQSMVRAEILDRFLNSGDPKRTGVLVVKILSSGGSRRESKNLVLGTKTDYSGSAVIKIALYDLDGSLRFSKVLSHHTGFRKSPNESKVKL